MAQDIKVGQFWRDTVNGDLLKILSFNREWNSEHGRIIATGKPLGGYVDYAKCACLVHGVFFGIQEMKVVHFFREDQRFKKVNWFKQWWYRRKYKASDSTVHAIPG